MQEQSSSVTVLQGAFNAGIHGPGVHMKATAQAGYAGAQHILYNVAINTDSELRSSNTKTIRYFVP